MIPFINKVNQVIINPIIVLALAVAVCYFIYSIINLILESKEGGKELQKRKDAVIYSIVGIFIMVSVYGIINFILSSIDVSAPPYLKNKLEGQ